MDNFIDFACVLWYTLYTLREEIVLFGGIMKLSVSVGALERRIGTEEAFRIMKEQGFGYADYGFGTWFAGADALRNGLSAKMSENETREYYTVIRKARTRRLLYAV